jgi:hypothetical protein
MESRSASTRRPAYSIAAALLAMLATAGTHAAEAVGVAPLKATRFVYVGLTGSDALSLATDRCVDLIEARAATAVAACRLAVRRARAAAIDPLSVNFASRTARRDQAFALGNLAVAQQLAGDNAAAQSSLALALEYSPDEPLLLSNLAALEARRLAASTTAGKLK